MLDIYSPYGTSMEWGIMDSTDIQPLAGLSR